MNSNNVNNTNSKNNNQNIVWSDIRESCTEIGNNFVELYMDAIDNRRNEMHNLYSDQALLMWDCFYSKGRDAIQTFYNDLTSTVHTVLKVEISPMLEHTPITQQRHMIMITVVGTLKQGNRSKPDKYTKTLTISPLNGFWQIVVECFMYEPDEALKEPESNQLATDATKL